VDPRPSPIDVALDRLPPPPPAPREPPLLEDDRDVVARSAPCELRTPPTEAPPELPPSPAFNPPELDPPPPNTDEELAIDEDTALAALLDELELPPLDPLPPEPRPSPPLDDPPPPLLPPRLRPMKAPPPPEKLRLPRICGPKIVENLSGPVVPVKRIVSTTLPPATVAVRTAAVNTRLALTASSVRCRWYSHQAPAHAPAIRIIHSHPRFRRLGGSGTTTRGLPGVSAAGLIGTGALLCCMALP
jgi:hypothetical protein